MPTQLPFGLSIKPLSYDILCKIAFDMSQASSMMSCYGSVPMSGHYDQSWEQDGVSAV